MSGIRGSMITFHHSMITQLLFPQSWRKKSHIFNKPAQ